VSCVTSLPSGCITKRFRLSPSLSANAIPCVDHFGDDSDPAVLVSRVRFDPSAFITNRSYCVPS